MGLFNSIRAKNNRARISEKIEILAVLYDKIDKCFHENFKLTKVGLKLSECIYSTNSNSFRVIESWKREFKTILSEVLNLLSEHTLGWLDSDNEKWIDRRNQEQINYLTEKYNQIRDILDCSQIDIK